MKSGDDIRHDEVRREMPAGLVENEDSRVVRDLGCDLDEMQAHGYRVGGGHDDGGALRRLRSLRIPQDRQIRNTFKPKRTPFQTNQNGAATVSSLQTIQKSALAILRPEASWANCWAAPGPLPSASYRSAPLCGL